MFRRMKAVIVAVLAFVLWVPAIAAQEVGLPVGTVPAAVQVEDLDGNAVDLGRYIGKKPVLFEFWATWCELCEALEPTLAAARKTYGDRVDFVIIAVGVSQTPRTIRRHLENHAVSGTLYYDAGGVAVREFKAPTTSYVVILDATGKVTYTGTGGSQPIAEALARVTS